MALKLVKLRKKEALILCVPCVELQQKVPDNFVG
jgi:hypothetical protein